MLKFYVYIIWIENSKGTKENKIPKKKKLVEDGMDCSLVGIWYQKKKMDHVEMKRLI